MAGTYLQSDVYGEIADFNKSAPVPAFDNATMTDHQLVKLVREVRAVAEAHKSCDWVVVTAMYQRTVGLLKTPHTNTSACWLAFVDRDEHSAIGWTKIPLTLFSSFERNENAFKVMMPAVLPKHPIVFVNHALPQARCLALPHMVRAAELAEGHQSRPHLLASKIPNWSGRSHLPGYIEMARGYLERRNATVDVAEFEDLLVRMSHSGFNTSIRWPVVDTLWMIWPTADAISEKMSKLWLHEVARFSSYEKLSYPWILSQVPEFRARLTDAIYIYSPQQRVCPGDPNASQSPAASRKAKRRLHGRSKRGRRMLQL